MEEKTQNIGDFQKKLEEQQKLIEDYTISLKRLQADFENYIKRAEKDKEDLASYSNHKLVSKLLNVVDDFEKALEFARKNKELADGLEMIYKQFNRVLHDEGVSAINAVGTKLDPFKHDVIDIVSGEKDDLVVEELQKGYMIKNKVLRPSKVRISKTGSKD